jgi:histidinol-phosphate aminotransferase
MTARVPVRSDLADVEPYGAPQLDVPVRLNTNETPYPPPPVFTRQLGERIAALELNRYPDRRVWQLRTALGQRAGLPPEQVWAANGSNEVLLQLFQAYGGPGRRIMLARPGYSAHPLIARVSGTETVEFDLDGDLCLTADVACAAVEALDPDIVCVANPNNPTGLAVDLGVIRAIHDASRALVVVDEAYVEFGGASAVVLLEDLPRLAVCRTFSKAFRLAGIRLGYLYAHGWVIDDLRKVRLPYHLDSLTQQAGLVACELAEDVTAHIDGIALERERVHEALEAQGLQVYPSAANFLLFRSPVPDLFDRLLDHGVLVRDFSTRPRLEGCLRVSIGTPEENDRFIDALKECLL